MDNLSNNCGTELVIIGQKERAGTHVNLGDNRQDFLSLEHCVKASTSDVFKLSKVCSCGTDANVHSILEATDGDTSKCLFAAGSYLGGDDSVLHMLSTSEAIEVHGPAVVCLPHNASNFGQKQNVGLPYHIPCDCCADEVRHPYEDMCLRELHIRLLIQRLSGEPYKALVLELCLAGCGAILSNRALEKLGHLAKNHNLRLIVDEIMTGGRTSATSILLTQTKPLNFQAQVSHITMGKWPGIGLVLHNQSHDPCNKITDLASNSYKSRGLSSQPSCTHALVSWRAVIDNLHIIDSRRQSILDHKKCSKHFGVDDCWGVGLMIFLPYKRNGDGRCIKNRLLPLLSDAKLDSLKGANKPEWNKSKMCELVMGGVKKWVEHHPTYAGQGIVDRALCTWASVTKTGTKMALTEAVEKTRVEWEKQNGTNEISAVNFNKDTANTLSRARGAALFDYQLLGSKRERKWITTEECFYHVSKVSNL
jgi:hypothetical protein